MTLLDTVARVEIETGNFLENPSFSKIEPRLQIAHDASSIKCGEKCWRYYQLSIIEGWTLPGTNDHLRFGSLLHSSTELYDHLRIGKVTEAVALKLINIRVPEETVLKVIRESLTHAEALRCVMRFILSETWNFETKESWKSIIPEKTRITLLRTVILYLDKFQDDPLETVVLQNGKPAVELSFRMYPEDFANDGSFIAPTGEEYIICGHIDKVIDHHGSRRIKDIKTTMYYLNDNYFKQFTPDVQVSIYSIAGETALKPSTEGFIIDAIQTQVTGNRFRRTMIDRSPEYLEEWIRNFKRYLRELETCVKENYFPMNETACGFGNFQCQFRPICSTDPSARQDWLEAQYIKRTWNPIQPR